MLKLQLKLYNKSKDIKNKLPISCKNFLKIKNPINMKELLSLNYTNMLNKFNKLMMPLEKVMMMMIL